MTIRSLLVALGCAAALGACSPDGPCHYNGDCADGLFCVSGQCQAVAGACSGRDCLSVSAPCDLYAPHCPSDRRCALTGFDGEGRPLGTCLPAGGGELGAACSDRSPCQPDLVCVADGKTSAVCRSHCDLASPATCAAPLACQPLVRLDPTDVPRHYGVCFPDSRYLDPCANDAACDAGQVCTTGPDGSAPTVLKNQCRWPAGTKGAAAPCDADAECESGYCLPGAPAGYGSAASTAGICHAGCSRDADCPAANGKPGGCAGFGFTWPDAQGKTTLQPVPSCVVSCTGAANCRAGNACLPVANAQGTAFLAHCSPANPGGTKPGGAPCASSAECAGGLCFKAASGATDGLCVAVCGSAADCDPTSECPPSGVLQMLAGPDGRYGTSDDVAAKNPICWGRTCVRDADCAGQSADPAKPRVCAADPDPRNPSDTLLACAPRVGAKGGGATCSTDADCASGWCVTWTSGSAAPKSRCFGACQTASECVSTTAEKTSCTNQKLNGSATRSLSICVPVF